MTEVTSDSSDEDRSSEPPLLSRRQQREFLKALQKLVSPLAACMQVDVLLDSYDLTRERDQHFRQKVERLFHAFDENVNAAMYRDAMGGSASAQANYLRRHAGASSPETDAAGRAAELAEMSTADLVAYQLRLRTLGGQST